VYLLIYIKPLDAFTSGAERLQSELVQTFPSSLWSAGQFDLPKNRSLPVTLTFY
jgi:hypothetical protein